MTDRMKFNALRPTTDTPKPLKLLIERPGGVIDWDRCDV
jgi:hypothetical protein